MMRSKALTWLTVTVVLVVVVAAVGCGEAKNEVDTSAGTAVTDTVGQSSTTETPGKVFELTYAHMFPATHPIHKRLEQWASVVSDATNGQVKIVFHPAQTLLTAPETYEGVVRGVADMGMMVPSYTPGLFPLFELFDLPVDYNDCQVSTRVVWDCYKKFQPEEFSQVKPLSCFAIGPGGIATKKPIRTLEDLKGKQIRAVGLSANYMSALGAAPVSITMPEAYEAVSRGVCDGVLNTWDAFVTWKLIEVSECFTMTQFLYCALFFTVMNLDTWNSLPGDIQAVLAEVCEKQIAIDAKDEADNAIKSIGTLLDAGKEIILLSEEEGARWREAVKPPIDAAIQDREARGLEARAFYDEMVRLAAEYNPGFKSVEDSYLEIAKQ